MIEEIERAVAKILKFSGQSKVFICGHSAGAHLAALMLHTDFKQKYNVDSKNLAGLILVSRVFDLGLRKDRVRTHTRIHPDSI